MKGMKKSNDPLNSKVLALAVAALIILALALYVVWSMPQDFVFRKHLDETAVTIRKNADAEGISSPSCEVSLKEMSYYIMLSEENVQRLAEVYNESNTNQFWNLFTNHTFFKSKAKEVAYDACVRDVIYTFEAEAAGMSLDAEEVAKVKERAQDLYDGLTYKQQTETEMDPECIERVLMRVFLASKYANHLVETHDFSASTHMPEVEVEIGGDYYESIKAGYTVTDAAWWKDINLGKITIEQRS